jgi:hypothetical protein
VCRRSLSCAANRIDISSQASRRGPSAPPVAANADGVVVVVVDDGAAPPPAGADARISA